MGTIWVAHHERLATDVVVKFLAETLIDNDELRERFEREVKATAAVKSPHVVQTLDHGVAEDGTPYIVMELLEGSDVSRVLKARKRLEPREVLHVVRGVAAALTKAHGIGVVHRDIKPANIFLCNADGPEPHVKLVDFGIAKLSASAGLTVTGELLGTPWYMSPEQLEGSRGVDHRADLWALGILAFHTLVGRTPFNGDHVAAIAVAILTQDRPVPSRERADLPIGFDAWFAKACAPKIEDRFSTARELAAELESALASPSRDVIAVAPTVESTAIPSSTLEPTIASSPVALANPPSDPVLVGSGSRRSLPPAVDATPHPSVFADSHVAPPRTTKWLVFAVGILAVFVVGLAWRLVADSNARAAAAAPSSAPANEGWTETAPPTTPPALGSASPTPAPLVTAAGSASGATKKARPARRGGPRVPGKPDDEDVGF
jgi:serine/threonine-protein kinase